MRVLYVSSTPNDDAASAIRELTALDGTLEFKTVSGPAAALVEIRTGGGYRAVFISPELSQNDTLALIGTLRRERLPVAIVPIITEAQRGFFAPAITAGVDDVLLRRKTGFVAADETLWRVRHSRYTERTDGQPRLNLLYIGQDEQAWDLLLGMPFVHAARATAKADGTSPLTMKNPEGATVSADVIVVDENPGKAHPLQVIRAIKAVDAAMPVVVLSAATGTDAGGAALDVGADDVVSKAKSYGRRLIATLHKRYRGQNGTLPAHEEVLSLRAALALAEKRIQDLAAEARVVTDSLDSQRQGLEQLRESEGFERAMRDRDREELVRLRKALAEERDRRAVLEGTLRQTEDRAARDLESLETRHMLARRELEARLASAADRLHHVADETQALHTHLQQELSAQAVERDRLVESALVGYAAVTADGRLIRCNTTFAAMFGFEETEDAIAADAETITARLGDHAHVVNELRAGRQIARVESVVFRANGQPFRVLTSASILPGEADEPELIERLLVDLDDRTQLEEQLRLARRLESAGRLAAEMSTTIEPALRAIEGPNPSAEDRERIAMLVRQLMSFSRRQAKPAGLLSITDAVRRSEPLLRQIAGDAINLELRLEDVAHVAAGEDDIEQLASSLLFAAASCLPYGGSIVLQARSVRSGFDVRTELAVTAAGYGVQPILLSPSLARLVTRCGGTVHVSDDPGRISSLIVHLPC